MVWWKADDGLMEHPKILALSNAAFRLFLFGNIYCSRELTDGVIPVGVAEGYAFRCSREGLVSWESLVSELTTPLEGSENPLWERERDAFRIHDFLVYNPSREQVLAERERGTKRVRAYRARRASAKDSDGCNAVTQPVTPHVTSAVSHGACNGAGNAVCTDGPVPVPVPGSRDPELAGGLAARSRASDADELLIPDLVAGALREALGRDLCMADHRRVDGWVRDGMSPSMLAEVISDRAASAKKAIRSSKWFEQAVLARAEQLRVVPLEDARSDLLGEMKDSAPAGLAERARMARDVDELSEVEASWFESRADLPGNEATHSEATP